MILRGFSGLLKISRDGFEMIKISKDCVGSAGASVGSATGVMLAIGADSRDAVGLGVDNASDVEDVEITFEFSEDSWEREIILIIFFIFSSLKSLRMNLFNNIINNFRIFMIIIIFFKGLFKSFRLKNLNLLNIIFFSN